MDCSIDLRTIPQNCNLLGFWPLTSNHIAGNGNLIEIAAGQHASFSSTVIWPEANIVDTTETRQVPDLRFTEVGALSAKMNGNHFKHQKITMVAFVNFNLEGTDYYKLYPFITFGDSNDMSGSSVLFISPSGDFSLYYTAFGESYHLNATFVAPEFLGIGGWTMIGMIYESFPTSYQVTFFGLVDTYTHVPKYTVAEPFQARPTFSLDELWIGSTYLNETVDRGRVFPGKIACLAMYNDVLTGTEVLNLFDACKAVVGAATPVAATQSKCDVCTEPPLINQAIISEVKFESVVPTPYDAVCPVFTRIESDIFARSQTGTCSGPEVWVTTSNCSLDLSPVQCDPMCLNGGDCYCDETLQSCYCMCQPGFTGPDCILDTSLDLIPDSAVVFWPMSSDTIVTVDGNLKALDFSAWEQKLTLSGSVGMLGEVFSGAYGTTAKGPLFNSFELDPHMENSYLSTMAPLNLNGSFFYDGMNWENLTVEEYHESFVVVFYLNFHFVNAFGDMPIFGVSNNGSSIYLDYFSGQFRYYPDDILIPHIGEILGDKLETWLLVSIFYNKTSGEIGSSAFAVTDPQVDPDNFTVISTPKFNTTSFYIGYDVQGRGYKANFAMSCFGIYAQDYSQFKALFTTVLK